MKKPLKITNKGFTLIEILVVIVILAILLSIAISTYSGAQKSGRLAKRITDLKAISTALDLYRFENNSYPVAASWRSECALGGGLSADDVISGLIPKYLKVFPSDPRMDKTQNTSCYMYISTEDGSGYKIIDYQVEEFSADDYLKHRALVDSARDGGADPCKADGESPQAFGFYTYNACGL